MHDDRWDLDKEPLKFTYDSEFILRMVECRSGLDAEVIGRVLEAKEEYLSCIGATEPYSSASHTERLQKKYNIYDEPFWELDREVSFIVSESGAVKTLVVIVLSVENEYLYGVGVRDKDEYDGYAHELRGHTAFGNNTKNRSQF